MLSLIDIKSMTLDCKILLLASPSRPRPCAMIFGLRNSGLRPVSHDISFWMVEADSGTKV